MIYTLWHSDQTTIIAQSHISILHLIFGTSFLHHSEFLIRIIHPPLSDFFSDSLHAGLTCYTLLSPSITFSLFHSKLKTYLFRKSYPPP